MKKRRVVLFDHIHSWHYYRNYPREIFWGVWLTLRCAYERAVYGWDQPSTWDMDRWFCDQMIPMLHEFKDSKQGIPSDFLEKYDSFEAAREAYNDILDEIIEGMEAGLRIIDAGGDLSYAEWKKQEEEDYAKHRRGMDLFKEFLFTLWT